MPLSSNENQLGSFFISICGLFRQMNRYGYTPTCIYHTRLLFTYIDVPGISHLYRTHSIH